jgi:hypothetical protein
MYLSFHPIHSNYSEEFLFFFQNLAMNYPMQMIFPFSKITQENLKYFLLSIYTLHRNPPKNPKHFPLLFQEYHKNLILILFFRKESFPLLYILYDTFLLPSIFHRSNLSKDNLFLCAYNPHN